MLANWEKVYLIVINATHIMNFVHKNLQSSYMKQRAMVILDGGMGRELQRSGAPFRQPEWSALALSEAPKR